LESLVNTDWLTKHLYDSDLVVLDSTVAIKKGDNGKYEAVSGRASYESGHIPTAGFADLMGDLVDTDSQHQFAVPTPEAFVSAMSQLGVSDESRVVLYDANGSIWAARVWWMLRWIGFDRASLLDGGLQSWTKNGGSLSTESAVRNVGQLTCNERPELIVQQDEVLAAINDDSVDLVDALTRSQYTGDASHYGRPGHIPTAANVPYSSLIDDSGHYRTAEELATLFHGDHDTRTINYCGGGIAASATAFIMTRLGYSDVAVYTASLQEWAADESKPLVTGSDANGTSGHA